MVNVIEGAKLPILISIFAHYLLAHYFGGIKRTFTTRFLLISSA
jgi:hypothetical protein